VGDVQAPLSGAVQFDEPQFAAGDDGRQHVVDQRISLNPPTGAAHKDIVEHRLRQCTFGQIGTVNVGTVPCALVTGRNRREVVVALNSVAPISALWHRTIGVPAGQTCLSLILL
jgi:hypothetical protein